MADARNLNVPAPTEVPEVFKDAKLPVFVRANLAVSYARTLAARRVHDAPGNHQSRAPSSRPRDLASYTPRRQDKHPARPTKAGRGVFARTVPRGRRRLRRTYSGTSIRTMRFFLSTPAAKVMWSGESASE